MKEVINKYFTIRNRNIIAIVVIILGIGFIVNYSFFEPTYINEYIATKVYKEPANSYFDDENFYKCVVDAYNSTNNTSVPYTYNLSDEELGTIKKLYCLGYNKSDEEKITSASGLERLKNVYEIVLTDNKLTDLDISKNEKLIEIYLAANELTTLNTNNNLNLQILDVGFYSYSSYGSMSESKKGNKITSLDLSNNTELERLFVSNNFITELDISKQSKLTQLLANGNQLTELDLTSNEELVSLDLTENQLTELDLTNNQSLVILKAGYNKLKYINLDNNLFLRELSLLANNLTEIDVTNNTALTYLDVCNNQLTELDISENQSLKELIAIENQLTQLDLNNNPEITELHLYNNKLTKLNLSNNTKLSYLNVSNNLIEELKIGNNSNLKYLNLGGPCNYIDPNKPNYGITSPFCGGNKLTELDLSGVPFIEELYVSNNSLTELDIYKLESLKILKAFDNKLTELNVSNNLLLQTLELDKNELTELDVSNNTKLRYLVVLDNPFSEKVYTYKFNSIQLEKKVKLPAGFSWPNSKWVSENENIAIVDNNGTVNTQQIGTAIIKEDVNSKYTAINTINVVEITSNKYLIDEEKSDILVGFENNLEVIKNNINVSNENVTVNINDDGDKLLVKYEEEVLKEFDVIRFYSDEYDLAKDYIYTGNDEFNIDSINVINCSKIEEDNKLIIKYNDTVLDEYTLVSISSEKYDLTKEYIYIGNSTLDLEKINNINCDEEIKDNKLIIKYNDIVLDEYELLSIKFNNYNVFGNKIVVLEEVSYEDFINDIEVSDGITYKIFNGEEEVTNGNIEKNMLLKIYYNEIEIDEYIILDEYLEFDDILDIDMDNSIINKVESGTNIEDIKSKINTSGTISVLDKDSNVVEDTNKKIGTGYKFKIEMSSNIFEYVVSVRGDINGDGLVNINDVIGVSRHVIMGNYLEGLEYINASDINSDDKVDINDVIRLAKHIVNNSEL